MATPLSVLVSEAERRNPEISAAEHAWRAASYVPRQASALPDPHLVVQQLNVGSPRPFAGFSNDSFAYLGFGVSQDLPYPGKRDQRATIAEQEADSLRQHSEAIRRTVIAELKSAYYEIAYLQQTLPILESNGKVLQQIGNVAESRYSVGHGNQQDVLKAQLQRTKLLRDIALHHQQEGQFQGRLKQLLNRSQLSPDIVAEPLTLTPLTETPEEILDAARVQNPDLAAQNDRIERQETQVQLARSDSKPDFNLQGMYQHTSGQFRDYYMLTFGVRLPRREPQRAAVAEASEQLEQARQQYQAGLQATLAAAQEQLVTVRITEEQARIFSEGLIPQATASFRAGMAAYESDRQDFQTLLSSFLDVLDLDLEYRRTIADHQIARAEIERLAGVKP
jgi:outer membrane protein TolC